MKKMKLKGTRVYYETLGCSKNQVDTETMIGILEGEAFITTLNPSEAKIIVVNTCGFIESAKEESIDAILSLSEYKKSGQCKYLIVTGCLAQRYAQELVDEIPQIDAVLGTTSFDQILQTVNALENPNNQVVQIDSIDKPIPENLPRRTIGPKHSAFLKIAEGCDNCCTYCIIPQLRGKYRSRTMTDVLNEATVLVQNGAKELMIIAQDITRYGIDLDETNLLPQLLTELNKIEGLEWIRLQYAYPDMITKELIESMSINSKVCHYIDIPIQHASDVILRRMNRKTTKAQIYDVVNSLRKAIPDISIRTTLIVGFPGETDGDFKELLELISDLKFDRLGAFQYSREEGTPADLMTDHISDEIKQERFNTLMQLQQGISETNMANKIGETIGVLIEEKVPDELVYIGRSAYDAPEIDGVVYVNTALKLSIGEIYSVRITDAMEYDWIGEII